MLILTADHSTIRVRPQNGAKKLRGLSTGYNSVHHEFERNFGALYSFSLPPMKPSKRQTEMISQAFTMQEARQYIMIVTFPDATMLL